jgi:hypothetical protein
LREVRRQRRAEPVRHNPDIMLVPAQVGESPN